jgi:hypothetical protein
MVVFGVAVLAAVGIPMLPRARHMVDRTNCLNNLKNLGLAMHSYGTTYNGRLPGYGTWQADGEPRHSWVVDLLPYLDQQSVADNWNYEARWDAGEPTAEHSNAALSESRIRVLRCPEGTEEFGLSYVVNTGFANKKSGNVHDFNNLDIDWTNDGIVDDSDHEISRDSGVFWRTIGERSGGMGLDDFYDGASNTIMISESLHSGSQTWASPNVTSSGFAFAIDPTSGSFGNAKPDRDQNVTINGVDSKVPPMLSSNHGDYINYVNGEGGAKALDLDIDTSVLRRLVTPRGTLHGEKPMTYDEF